jgi:hypothetical protein
MIARRRLTMAAAVPLAVLLAGALAGCSPLSLFASWGDAPSPTGTVTRTSEAAPTESPSPTRTPSGSSTPGCVDRVISSAGTYRLDDCTNLTVSGSDITVTAGHLGTLTVNGSGLEVYAQGIGTLDVMGDLNRIETNDDIRQLTLTGSRNQITSHGSMASAVVTGDDNTVRVDGGIDGDVQNNGQSNAIGGQP